MSDIVWQDPPTRTGPGSSTARRSEVSSFVELLKTNPGVWALYPTPKKTGNFKYNRDRYPGTEWTSRSRPDGRRDLYGRWVGES